MRCSSTNRSSSGIIVSPSAVDDPELTGFLGQLACLALDLVAGLRRQRCQIPIPGGGQRQERRHPVLVVGLLDGEPRGVRGVAEESEPWLVLGQPAEIGVAPVVAREQRGPELLGHRILSLGEADGPHVVGDLGATEEPQRLADALERARRRPGPRRLPRRRPAAGGRASRRTPPSRASGRRECGRTCPRGRPRRARAILAAGSPARPH